jgi:hypothetical protein
VKFGTSYLPYGCIIVGIRGQRPADQSLIEVLTALGLSPLHNNKKGVVGSENTK